MANRDRSPLPSVHTSPKRRSDRPQWSLSRLKKQKQAVWQRRFWEHQVRDDADFQHYLDYIHTNPVGHELVESAKDLPYSSVRRYVSQYPFLTESEEVREAGSHPELF